MELLSVQHGPSQALLSGVQLVKFAKYTVIISSYCIEGQGTAGRCLLDALLECKAPLIKILTNHNFLDAMQTPEYMTLFSCSPNVQVRTWNHFFMNANHAKFIVVDNTFVSFGGYNFQEAYFMQPGEWSDLGLIVKSEEMASHLTAYFKIMWEQAKRVPCSNRKLKNLKICPAAKGTMLKLNKKVQSFQLLTQYPSRWFFHRHKSPAFDAILRCMDSAHRSISILSPDVIDTCVWEVLTDKLEQGVHVKIITNQNYNPVQTFATVGERDVDFFRHRKHSFLEIRFSNPGKGTTYMNNWSWPHYADHSKYFDVDEQHFYIGSFNMDAMSLHANGEIGIIVYDEPEVTSTIHSFVFQTSWDKAIMI